MNHPFHAMRMRSCSIVIAVATMSLGVSVTHAEAASEIEGVWSFNGGNVAVQSQPGETFVGTVVAPTKFAQCPHPVGEQMWTNIRLQADRSYWGLHQWYFESCTPNPTPGPTAWRVLGTANGSHFLRVCFSAPGSSQPTIAPNGSSANVTYGCVDSALIAPLPTAASAAQVLKRSIALPRAGKCFSHRVFRIHLRDPKNDPLKEVVVRIGRRRIAVVRHAGVIVATINLKGLPKGTFTVRIRATTVLGHHLSNSRAYHTCVEKASHKKSKRKRTKSNRHG